MIVDVNKTSLKTPVKQPKTTSQQTLFTRKLIKALNAKVQSPDGKLVSNMDVIIDNLIVKAKQGDKESVRLIKELTS